MKKFKSKLLMLFCLLILGGCATKLSDKESSFEAKGVNYEFQLPDSWEITSDFQETYSQQAVFGASDSKSNSSMFISGERKESVDLENFGETMRQKVATLYGYKKADDVYMKEFELDKQNAYKYTVKTKFDDRVVWLHIYYVETENGMVRFDFYSADDGKYEKRAEIIDESVRSLREISDQGTEENSEENDEVVFKNDSFILTLIGTMQLESDNGEPLIALRYTVTNTGKDEISANKWDELIQVTQKNEPLPFGEIPKETNNIDLSKLINQKELSISPEKTLEVVSIYQLKDNSNLSLIPSQSEFPTSGTVELDLSSNQSKGEQ